MSSYVERLSEQDLATLAAIVNADPAHLILDLQRRPWAVNDLLSDPAVFETILDRKDPPFIGASPFLLFAVLVHHVAGELRQATYVNDWTGPKSRLPVFDVAPLQEFLEDPGRGFFLASLLASFATPVPPPVPADPLDLHDLASWVDHALPADRIELLRRLGDLSLWRSGVFPDSTGPHPLETPEAQFLGHTAGLSHLQLVDLCDGGRISPGLDALETLGSHWYGAAAGSPGVPPILSDVAHRFRAARRILNHLSDRYLYRIEPMWGAVA
jgi:hypothetical protein